MPSSVSGVVDSNLSFLERMGRSALSILHGLADRLPYIVMSLLFLLVAWWLAQLAARLVRAALAKTSTEGHVDLLLGRLAGVFVFAVGLIVAMGIAGIQVSALVASLGLAGLTLGFALRDVLANSVSGVLLLLQRPFTIGDVISLSDCEGTVRDIRIRDTLIEQADGRMVFVPNATVFNATILNTSVASRRRLEVVMHVPLTADLEVARAAALQALVALPGLVEGAPVEALYVRTGFGSAALAARAWVDVSHEPFGRVLDAAITAVNASLRAAGITPAPAE